ncbi:hypothetical protein PpBr36_01148 [Pyricularia pennisetigena]|uniref:hypothetical protein n=1 Tax=Pyricularia pennisetigena TaxID=1578925 RepID=UPI0011506343|nr:hypothetical protein PpBr36_01148 [Pyricularia pennisetigena]TLS28221.1 hypothetical protein PpBr36_01148 [Pyricularia pennisetigena]
MWSTRVLEVLVAVHCPSASWNTSEAYRLVVDWTLLHRAPAKLACYVRPVIHLTSKVRFVSFGRNSFPEENMLYQFTSQVLMLTDFFHGAGVELAPYHVRSETQDQQFKSWLGGMLSPRPVLSKATLYMVDIHLSQPALCCGLAVQTISQKDDADQNTH